MRGLKFVSEEQGRLRMNQAQAVLEQTIAELERLRPGLRNTIAGEFRRSCDLVTDLRLIVTNPTARNAT